ncbi:hypothetical protein Aduo_007300 [Ancylostoma duodenale]
MAGGALLTTSAVYIRIENNPLLDPNCTHVLERYEYNRRIRGNLLNCGCELDGIPLTSITINDVEDNCAAIFGALYIFGPYTPSAESLMRKFGSATVAYGEIAVVDTDFEDLEFLGNIERVDIPYSRTGTNNLERFIRIEKNGKLQRLSWPKLKYVKSATTQIAANPKLCVTIPELNGFLEEVTVHTLEAKVCDGRLTIDHSSSDRDLWKLYNVSRIFGKLTIRNSSLVGFSSLWKLREIVNLAGYESAFVVEANARLASVFAKNLNRMLSDLPTRIENNPRLEMSLDDCDSYQRSAQIDFRNNKMDCLALRRMSASVDGNHGSIFFFFIVIGAQFT